MTKTFSWPLLTTELSNGRHTQVPASYARHMEHEFAIDDSEHVRLALQHADFEARYCENIEASLVDSKLSTDD